MRNGARLMRVLALIISHAMCACTAWNCCSLLWCGRTGGCSAPAWVGLITAIPLAAVSGICLLLAHLFGRKADRSAGAEEKEP